MGSAMPRPDGYDSARALFTKLETLATARQGEPHLQAMVEAIDLSLDDMATREATLSYLAAYIARCLSGSVPDTSRWSP